MTSYRHHHQQLQQQSLPYFPLPPPPPRPKAIVRLKPLDDRNQSPLFRRRLDNAHEGGDVDDDDVHGTELSSWSEQLRQ